MVGVKQRQFTISARSTRRHSNPPGEHGLHLYTCNVEYNRTHAHSEQRFSPAFAFGQRKTKKERSEKRRWRKCKEKRKVFIFLFILYLRNWEKKFRMLLCLRMCVRGVRMWMDGSFRRMFRKCRMRWAGGKRRMNRWIDGWMTVDGGLAEQATPLRIAVSAASILFFSFRL